jgi:hypothetical protein
MLISGMKATSIWKAFFLGSLIMALVSVGAIESRKVIENLGWFEDQHEIVKALGAFMVSFFVGIIAYLIMYVLFGYGEGMLVETPKK